MVVAEVIGMVASLAEMMDMEETGEDMVVIEETDMTVTVDMDEIVATIMIAAMDEIVVTIEAADTEAIAVITIRLLTILIFNFKIVTTNEN